MSKTVIPEVQEKLREWWQGDCVIGPESIVWRYNPDCPATPESMELDPNDGFLAAQDIQGLSILSQTCDIRKPIDKSPFLEVAPLVAVDDSMFKQIRSRRRPRYVEIPQLSTQKLVADLDRVMTIEKPTILNWKRTAGCSTDQQRRFFSEALSRKRGRAALPDDFGLLTGKLGERWIKRHDKDSDEGKILRAIQEIRVQPYPDWYEKNVAVRFWFLLEPEFELSTGLSKSKIEQQVEQWFTELVRTQGTRFEISYWVGVYKDMNAEDFVVSDRLDYEHLS